MTHSSHTRRASDRGKSQNAEQARAMSAKPTKETIGPDRIGVREGSLEVSTDAVDLARFRRNSFTIIEVVTDRRYCLKLLLAEASKNFLIMSLNLCHSTA